jgi:hypothetical protein
MDTLFVDLNLTVAYILVVAVFSAVLLRNPLPPHDFPATVPEFPNPNCVKFSSMDTEPSIVGDMVQGEFAVAHAAAVIPEKFHVAEKGLLPPLLVPACVTAMVLSGVTPVPLTVMVADRAAPELAAAVTSIVPLLLPLAVLSVHHVSDEATVNVVLLVMVNGFCSPATAKLKVVGVTASTFGAVAPNRKSSISYVVELLAPPFAT